MMILTSFEKDTDPPPEKKQTKLPTFGFTKKNLVVLN
jgi:hypothetical protein